MFKGIKNNKGVTMIELLGAMVILGMLMGIAVPAISDNIRKNRNQTYVNDAMKLISNAEYQFKKDNTIPKPTKTRCILMSLVYLNNGVFDEAPNGGEYLKNQSFVVAINDSSNKTVYYARLIEDMGDGEYRGIDYKTKSDLIKDKSYEYVTNVSGAKLFKIAGSSNATILGKVDDKVTQCRDIYVYAPNSNDE